MSDNAYNLLKYIAGGTGMLIFCAMVTYCVIEDNKITHHKYCPCPCEVKKGPK